MRSFFRTHTLQKAPFGESFKIYHTASPPLDFAEGMINAWTYSRLFLIHSNSFLADKNRRRRIDITTHAGKSGSSWSFNWPFFPDRRKNYCKMRGLDDGRVFFFAIVCFGQKFWRNFGEEKKLKIFKALKTSRLLNKKVELE